MRKVESTLYSTFRYSPFVVHLTTSTHFCKRELRESDDMNLHWRLNEAYIYTKILRAIKAFLSMQSRLLTSDPSPGSGTSRLLS